MKSLILILAHAPTKDKQKLLKTCIERFRQATDQFDIMVSSHTPIPEDIIQSVDYYVYDKDNRFSNGGGTILTRSVPGVVVRIFSRYTHQYPIMRLFRNGLAVAKENEYDFFYETDFDNHYSKEDINKLIAWRDEMFANNKKFIFFKPENAVWTVDHTPLYGIYYDLYITGGVISEFLEIIDNYFPKKLEDFNNKLSYIERGRPACLEHYFYDAFKHKIRETFIIDKNVKEVITSSELNKSGLESTLCTILPGMDGDPIPYQWPNMNGKAYLVIANDNIEPYTFKVYFDETLVGEYILHTPMLGVQSVDSMRVVEIVKDCNIKVDVFYEGEYLKSHTLTYTAGDIEKYDKDGRVQII